MGYVAKFIFGESKRWLIDNLADFNPYLRANRGSAIEVEINRRINSQLEETARVRSLALCVLLMNVTLHA